MNKKRKIPTATPGRELIGGRITSPPHQLGILVFSTQKKKAAPAKKGHAVGADARFILGEGPR